MNIARRKSILLALIVFAALVSAAHADTFAFATPPGSNAGGGPVTASAIVTTGAGTVTIRLADLLANPTDIAQLISDFDFVLSNGATTGNLASSSGQQLTVASGGTFTLGGTGSTGWGLNNNVGGGLQLDALGFVGPAGLIIGPPGVGGTYSNANSSIAGNGPHNPLIDQTATFVVNVAGVTAATRVTGVTFSFGTTAGGDIPGSSVPEPTTIAFFGTGLIGLGFVLRRKFSARR